MKKIIHLRIQPALLSLKVLKIMCRAVPENTEALSGLQGLVYNFRCCVLQKDMGGDDQPLKRNTEV